MIKVIPKIIGILEMFAGGQEFSFKEILLKTGLPRSNASHLLASLCDGQVLEKVGYGKYRRGERLTRLCVGGNPWQPLISKAERCADNLVLWLNELAVVAMRDGTQRLTLVKRKPVKNLQVEQETGRLYKADWYSSANGRILLAYAPDKVVDQIVRTYSLPERGVWHEAASLPKLKTELARIRERGHVEMDVDEVVRALAVPVRDASGTPLLSLATAFPVFSCRKTEPEIIAHLHSLAGTLEKELVIGGICVEDLKSNGGRSPRGTNRKGA